MRKDQRRRQSRELRRFGKDEMQDIAGRFVKDLDAQLNEKCQQREELEERITGLEGRIYALVTTKESTPHEIEQYFVIPMGNEKEELKSDLAKLKTEIFSLESARDRIHYLMELRGYWDKESN